MAEGVDGNWMGAVSPSADSDLINFDDVHCCNSYRADFSSRMDYSPCWQSQCIPLPSSSACQQQASLVGFLAIAAAQPAGHPEHPNGLPEEATLKSVVAQALETRSQQMHAPLARCLELNSRCPAALSDAVLQGPATGWTSGPYSGDATGSQQQQQEANINNGRQQLQQWLARQEAALLVRNASSCAHHSRNSSSASSNAAYINPIDEIMVLLPPPAFALMGLLG